MHFDFFSHASRRHKALFFLTFDSLCILLALLISAVAVDGGAVLENASRMILPSLCALLVAGVALNWRFGLAAMTLNAFEANGMIPMMGYAGLLGVVGTVFNALIGAPLSVAVFVVFAPALSVIAGGGRLLMRQGALWFYRKGLNRVNVLIYGAGQTGQQLVAALRADDKIAPVAFVDDNPMLQGTTVSRLRVYAPRSIERLVDQLRVDRIVLAMPSATPARRARLVYRMRNLGCEVHVQRSFSEMIGHSPAPTAEPLEACDLLGRRNLDDDLPQVDDTYRGRSILVSGAGGSIGSELCRKVLACCPRRLVLLDHSELALYAIEKELRELAPNLEILPILGSVCDATLVRLTLAEQEIEVVLHAAAYKHLPLVETNVISGLRNNVLGTRILAEAAGAAQVQRFILVSSDKAVRPTNVMGASKRLAEMVVQDLAQRSEHTLFSMVRFGNVLGSSGSVVPLFEEQIARGGPVTLTHEEVTRYFMTISEAARLVLVAGSFARGGDVFVLDMGDPVPIARLARQMIEGAGLTVRDAATPDGDIEIVVTGLRPGEKLHEELLIAPDMVTTQHNKILRAQEGCLSQAETTWMLRMLSRALEEHDATAALALIDQWVEGRTPGAEVLAGE